ncbi:MAG: type II toxin-antitoxin system prevent-host-death family antitoxin [Sulfuricellaceae bacterium]
MRIVSATDANRQFSSVLRDVSQGETFTVLSRGKPVATIAPAQPLDAQRRAAKAALVARLRKQEAGGERNWTRDELYDR